MRYVTIENCFPRSSCMLSILSMPSRNSFIYKTYIFWWVFKAKATFFLFMALNCITFNVGLKWWKKEPLKADRGKKGMNERDRERELNIKPHFATYLGCSDVIVFMVIFPSFFLVEEKHTVATISNFLVRDT